MVGLAGPGGAGKSTAASMVVAEVDVRASFHKGVLWLQVGQGATVRLPELMLRLAGMVYERVMSKACRPPRKAGLDKDPEDGAAYIQEVVDDSCRRFLVIADDVWDVEVLTELKRAGVWVLYTTRQDDLLPEPPLRLDEVLPEEAEMVLRRAADLDNDERLPDAAYELMRRCEFGVLHLAFVGRWGDVRGRKENRPWQRTLERIEEAQKGDKGGKPLSWRAAVLRAGLEELACDNPKHKELYLSLAILPKGLAFSSEVAAVLLYGDDFSGGDLDAASGVVATLERLSILTLRGGERYSVHDEHADFIQGCFEASRGTRDSVLRWWRGYLSSVRALVAFSSDWLVKSWDVLAHCEDKETPSRPYDVALGAMDSSNAELSTALEKVAEFQWLREDWSGAYSKYSQLLEIEEELLGVDHLDVALTLFTLGACAFRAGRMEEAEELCRRALAIREVKLGIGHPEVVSTLRELGVCLTNAGRRKEAEELLRQALAVQEGKLGFDHPDVAHTLHEFGVCLASEGRTKEAEECLRRALAIREEKLGADHPDVARTVQDLGVCLANAGRMKEAEDFLRRALAIRGDKLAVNHPDVASTLHSLGVCLSGSGRREEAEEFLQRALEIREKLGDDYLDVARTLHELGVCALTTETPAVAEKLYRRALAIREETLGVDHQDVARTLHELGVCLCNAGRRTEAEELYRRALAIRDEKVGVDPRDVANTLHGLGVCAGTAGRTNEAEELYRRALAIREETLGVDHLDVASTLYSLGVCLFNAGRMKEAEELHRRALAIRGEKLGVDDPRVARTRKALELASNSLSTCTVS